MFDDVQLNSAAKEMLWFAAEHGGKGILPGHANTPIHINPQVKSKYNSYTFLVSITDIQLFNPFLTLGDQKPFSREAFD